MKLSRKNSFSFAYLLLFATGALISACSSSPQTKPLSKTDHFGMLLNIASANLTENDATNALISLDEARELNDHDADLYYLYALAYYQKHEPRLAIESARRSLQIKPDRSRTKNTLGKLLMDQGNNAEAEKLLKSAASDLTFREAYIAKTNLGILYYQKTNLSEAERWFDGAIQDAGDAACMAAYYRGQIYSQRNELELARKDFLRATKNSCSRLTEAHLAEGKTLIRQKKYDQARVKLMEIQQLFPDSPEASKANTFLKEIP